METVMLLVPIRVKRQSTAGFSTWSASILRARLRCRLAVAYGELAAAEEA